MAIDAPIRISTNVEELQDSSEFLGEITADEITPSNHGPQYHLAVRPLNFAIAGKTGWFHEWAKISRHKRSKLGAMIVKFAEVFGKDKFLGQGDLVGQRAWFVRQDITFGTDRETGEELKAEAVLMPIRPMQPGDEALIVSAGTSPSGAPARAVSAPTAYTDEQIELLLSAIDGANADRLAIVAARTNLPAELKQAIMSGEALKTLTDLGLVTVTDDRKVAALTGAGGPAPQDAEEPPAPARAGGKAPKFAGS
jgi:hypothetical protein